MILVQVEALIELFDRIVMTVTLVDIEIRVASIEEV